MSGIALFIFFQSSFALQLTGKDRVINLNDTEFKDGLYLHDDRVFSGTMVAYYEGDQIKLQCEVLDGRLHGATTEFFSDGTIKNKRKYYLGKLFGDFQEFYPGGKLRLSGEIGLNDYHGGEKIDEIQIGVLKRSKLKIRSVKGAKIYFLDDKGKRLQTSEKIHIRSQTRYVIVSTDEDKIHAKVQ